MRINATRAEHAKPGVWEARSAALLADLASATAAGDDKGVRLARNGLIVLGLSKPA